MSLAENLHFEKSAIIAFDRSNANWLSPNPYTNRKSKHARRKSCMSALFSVSDVFANAKVMLCYAQ